MNTFKTQDNITVKRVSRWIAIHFDYITPRHSLYEYSDDGMLDWFRHNGRKYALDQFMRLSYPTMFEDESGKISYLSGYDCTQWYKPYLIEIHPGGEYIRLYEEVKEEEY